MSRQTKEAERQMKDRRRSMYVQELNTLISSLERLNFENHDKELEKLLIKNAKTISDKLEEEINSA